MCRCNNICSLFQAESVIMTFQFHLENIPFFRCLRAQTSSSSEQNIKKFSAGLLRFRLLWMILLVQCYGESTMVLSIRPFSWQEHSSRDWLSWSDIIPWWRRYGNWCDTEGNTSDLTDLPAIWTTGIKLQSRGMIDHQVFFIRLQHT